MKKIVPFALLFLWACSSSKKLNQAQQQGLTGNEKIFSIAFQQKAAEYKALCLQAYQLAHWKLDQHLAETHTKPTAVITDIDETVLDNSPNAVHQALQGKDYEQTAWYQWTAMAAADTVPGAPGFLKYAASKGVEIIYITNRDEQERAATLQNLQRYNLPNADNAHLIMRQGVSSKEARRQQVMVRYDVLLLCGDNLADFSALFDKKTIAERDQNVNSAAALFGDRFIVLPNPVYGDWENALYEYKRFTPLQKDSAIKAQLKTY